MWMLRLQLKWIRESVRSWVTSPRWWWLGRTSATVHLRRMSVVIRLWGVSLKELSMEEEESTVHWERRGTNWSLKCLRKLWWTRNLWPWKSFSIQVLLMESRWFTCAALRRFVLTCVNEEDYVLGEYLIKYLIVRLQLSYQF